MAVFTVPRQCVDRIAYRPNAGPTTAVPTGDTGHIGVPHCVEIAAHIEVVIDAVPCQRPDRTIYALPESRPVVAIPLSDVVNEGAFGSGESPTDIEATDIVGPGQGGDRMV